MKRVIIIHGWDESPDQSWFPWLQKELEQKEFEVVLPQMPDPEEPKISAWVKKLTDVIDKPTSETFLIGHSIGCQTILRYLQKINTKIGGAIFVAGWFTLQNLSGKDEWNIAKSWLETPIDLLKVKENLNKSIAIFSKNDPFISLDDSELFKEELGSEIIILDELGHIYEGINELPIVLEKLLEIAQ